MPHAHPRPDGAPLQPPAARKIPLIVTRCLPPTPPPQPHRRGAAQIRLLVAAIGLAAALLLAGCGNTAFGGERSGDSDAAASGGSVRTAIAARTTTAAAAATTSAGAAAERQRVESTTQAERRATVGAQVFLVETTSAERMLRQTAAAQATVAAAPTPRPTATPKPPPPPAAAPAAPQVAEQAQLRFVKLNEDDDPSCITVAVRGIGTAGWSFRVDGSRLAGRFDRSGNARACGLGRRQEVTFTVFNGAGQAVAGGRGVPARGSAIMQARWR